MTDAMCPFTIRNLDSISFFLVYPVSHAIQYFMTYVTQCHDTNIHTPFLTFLISRFYSRISFPNSSQHTVPDAYTLPVMQQPTYSNRPQPCASASYFHQAHTTTTHLTLQSASSIQAQTGSHTSNALQTLPNGFRKFHIPNLMDVARKGIVIDLNIVA